MKRRFRPTFGGLVLESKANANNATTASSDASTTAQPTRRARFKPKVGLVAGKTSNQTKASAEVPTNANQTSASTAAAASPANKSAGQHPSTGGSPPLAGTKNNTATTPAKNQPSHGTKSVASPGHNDAVSQPLTGTEKATVTTAAGGKPTGHQSVQSGRCPSPVKNNVGGQTSTTTSSKDPGSQSLVDSPGASLVNDGVGTQPSAGTNDDTMVESSDNPPSTGQQSTGTSTGGLPANKPGNSPLSAGTNKDTLTRSVGKQTLYGQQPSSNRTHSSTLSKGGGSETGAYKNKITTNVGKQSSFGGKTPSLPVNAIGNKDSGSEPSAGTRTDNLLAVNENAGNEPSKLEAAKKTDDQISTGTNKHAITASEDRSSFNCQRVSLQEKAIPNASETDQPRRRARIRPKVGLASAKASVQKTVPSKEPTPSSVTISSDTIPSSSATANTACQALTDPVDATRTSTTNATALPETSVPNIEATTSEQSVPTRRSRIIPKVGKVSEKILKSPVKKTTPVCQSTISVEVPSVDTSVPPEGTNTRASTTSANLNESALIYEKDTANVVSQPFTGSTVGEPNTEQTANTSEKNVNTVNPSLTSNNRATENSNSSAPEKSKITNSSATAQPTRRARFKPRVGIIGSRCPAVPTQRTQTMPSAVNKPPLAPTSSRDGAGNDTDSRKNLTQCPDKFVPEENRSTQAKAATLGRNTEEEQPQSRATVERNDMNSTSEVRPTFGGENVTVAVSANINRSAQERVEHEAMVLSTNVSECNQSTDSSLAEQSTSLACVELSDERQPTVEAETIHSNTKPVEVSNDITSHNNVSPESVALLGSLQHVVILPQDNEQVCGKKDLASARTASCLPVMMEDCSIFHPENQAGDGLSQISAGLGDEDTPDHSTAVIIDSDLSKIHQLETADDLLRTLLGGNLPSGYVPPRTHVDTRTTTLVIQSNLRESIHTPSSSTTLENETIISTLSDEPVDEVRTLPLSNQVDSTLNQSTQPAENKQTTATSRLVTKRQRGRPRNKQRSQPPEVSVLDISTIPIASNIEIEPEVCISEDIDHPVLELPVDLIQENLPQNSPKESVSSGGLKQRFKQGRSRTVKLVLSRQRSENSDVEKMNESVSTSGERGSTMGVRSSTAVDRSSTAVDKSSTSLNTSGTSTDRRSASVDSGRTSMDSSTLIDRSRLSISGDSSTSQNTSGQGVAEKSRENPRKARIGPNIVVRRKSNKRNDLKKSTSESRIFVGEILEPESQDSHKSGAMSVDPLSSSGQEAILSSAKDLSSSVQHCVVTSKQSSVTDESVIDLSNEFQVEVKVTDSASAIADLSEQDLSNDLQSEIVLSEDDSKLSSSVQESGNNTSENAENLVRSRRIIPDTSVKDLSKDCEVEIVLEVTNAAQDNSNIVYESSGDVSTSGACRVIENQSGYTVPSLVDELQTESALESSNHVQDNADTVCQPVHNQLGNVNANLSDNNKVHELTQNSNQVVSRTDRTDDDITKTNIPDIQSSTSLHSFSSASPETTTKSSHTTLQAQETSKSLPENKSTANSGPKSARPNSSTPLLDISSNPPDSSTVQSVCNDGQTKPIAKFSTTDSSEAECILADPKSSTPLHDVSLNIPDSTIEQCLSNELETNEHSQSDTEDISTDKNTTDPISTSQTEDVSLDIPESAIEEAIRNTNEPLPDVIECPECPELVLCLTTVDDASINEHAQNTAQTQPGTLEDSVARAMRRASGEFEEPVQGNDVRGERFKATSGNVANSETSTATNEKAMDSEKSEEISKSKKRDKTTIQRKRKTRGKIIDDDDEVEDINGSNVRSRTQADDGNKGTHDTSGNDDLGVQDGSLGDTCVQDGTTQDSRGSREGSTPDRPNDPTQDGTGKKPGSRKRQAKATKPKIPAKRGRKTTAVVQESENIEPRDENEQGTTDTPEGETSLRNTSATLPETEETPPISQKRKRGRPKGWKKSATEKSKQPETACGEETPSKKRKGQRTKTTEKLDAVVNISNMKICDMITYNPMTNPMTSSTNDEERQSSFPSGISSQNSQSEAILPANEDQPVENVDGGEKTAVCAPRVTIDADGNIVLDEESLVIESTPVPDTLDKEVVFENANQQYKATQKRKNMDRWGKEETLYFYEVLSQIGTDFTLMAKLFPKRNRSELKRKFKREEKVNRDLIDKALSQRIPLAASLFADCLEETEEEMERSLVVQTAATETAAQA